MKQSHDVPVEGLSEVLLSAYSMVILSFFHGLIKHRLRVKKCASKRLVLHSIVIGESLALDFHIPCAEVLLFRCW